MNIHGHTSKNWAANVKGSTCITKAFNKRNAVEYLRQHDPSLKENEVYEYEGSTDTAPVDEVYNDPIRIADANRDNIWKDIYKVRMREEYAHLVPKKDDKPEN